MGGARSCQTENNRDAWFVRLSGRKYKSEGFSQRLKKCLQRRTRSDLDFSCEAGNNTAKTTWRKLCWQNNSQSVQQSTDRLFLLLLASWSHHCATFFSNPEVTCGATCAFISQHCSVLHDYHSLWHPIHQHLLIYQCGNNFQGRREGMPDVHVFLWQTFVIYWTDKLVGDIFI